MKLKCDICGKEIEINKLKFLTEKNINGNLIAVKYCSDERCEREAHRRTGYEFF